MQSLTPRFFFSDAHLGAPNLEDDAQRQQAVIRFLEYAAGEGGEIYIVGDLFEFWFEYRRVIPAANFPVLVALYRIAGAGTRIHYLPGNHDLWIGRFMSEELGLIVHKRETRVQHGALNLLVTHGDGMAPSDRGYRFLRRIFTSRINIALYRLLHPDFGIPLAQRSSQVSREKGNRRDRFAEEYRQFARDCFRRGYDGVIMGHTHHPLHELYDGKHYINLGDWIDHMTYCELRSGEPELRQWPSRQLFVRPKPMPVERGLSKNMLSGTASNHILGRGGP